MTLKRNPGDRTSSVLVADDVPHVRRLIASYLAELGYSAIDMASTGMEVVSAFRQTPFDLAFLDIEMPGMDGLAALREVLNIFPHSYVVIVTAQGTLDNVRLAIEAGARGFLVKPFSHEKVLETITTFERTLSHT